MEPGDYFDTATNQWGGLERFLAVALATGLTCLLWHYLTARASVENADKSDLGEASTMDEPDAYEVVACGGGSYSNPIYDDQLTLDELTTEDHQLLLMYVQRSCVEEMSEAPVPKYAYLETIAEESSDDLRSDESRSDASGRWGWDCSSTDGAPSVIHVPPTSSSSCCQQEEKLREIELVRSMSKEEELDKWLEDSIREMEENEREEEEEVEIVVNGDEHRIDFTGNNTQWINSDLKSNECSEREPASVPEGRSNDGLSMECWPEASARAPHDSSPPPHHLAEPQRSSVAMETNKRTAVVGDGAAAGNCSEKDRNYVHKMNFNNACINLNTNATTTAINNNNNNNSESCGPRDLVEQLRMSNSDLLILFENEDQPENQLSNFSIGESEAFFQCHPVNRRPNRHQKEEQRAFAEWNDAIDEYLYSLVSWSDDGATCIIPSAQKTQEVNNSSNSRFQRSSSLDDIWRTNSDFFALDHALGQQCQSDERLTKTFRSERNPSFRLENNNKKSDAAVSNTSACFPKTVVNNISDNKSIFNQGINDKFNDEDLNNVALISGLSECVRSVDNSNNSSESFIGNHCEPVSHKEQQQQQQLPGVVSVETEQDRDCDERVIPSSYDKSVAVCDVTPVATRRLFVNDFSHDWSDSPVSSSSEDDDDEPRILRRTRRGVCENLTLIDSSSGSDSEASSGSDGQYECFNGHVTCDVSLVRSLSLSELRSFASCETLHRVTSYTESPRERREREGDSSDVSHYAPTRPSTENLSEDSGYCEAAFPLSVGGNPKVDAFTERSSHEDLAKNLHAQQERRFTIGVILEEDNESVDAMIGNKTISARARLEQLLIRDHERRTRVYVDAELSESKDELKKNIFNNLNFNNKTNNKNSYNNNDNKAEFVLSDRFKNATLLDFNEMDSIGSLSNGASSWQDQLLEQEWERSVVSGRAATDDWFSVKIPRALRSCLGPSRSLDCLRWPSDVSKTSEEPSKKQKAVNGEVEDSVHEVVSAPASIVTTCITEDDKNKFSVNTLLNEKLMKEKDIENCLSETETLFVMSDEDEDGNGSDKNAIDVKNQLFIRESSEKELAAENGETYRALKTNFDISNETENNKKSQSLSLSDSRGEDLELRSDEIDSRIKDETSNCLHEFNEIDKANYEQEFIGDDLCISDHQLNKFNDEINKNEVLIEGKREDEMSVEKVKEHFLHDDDVFRKDSSEQSSMNMSDNNEEEVVVQGVDSFTDRTNDVNDLRISFKEEDEECEEESLAGGSLSIRDDKGPSCNAISAGETETPNRDPALLLEGKERPRSIGPDLAEGQRTHEASLLGGVSSEKGTKFTTSKSSPDLSVESTTEYGRQLSRRMARPNIRVREKDDDSSDDEMFSWSSPRHVSRASIPTSPYIGPDGLPTVDQPSLSPTRSPPTVSSEEEGEISAQREHSRVHVLVVRDTCTQRSMKGVGRRPPPPPPPPHSSKSDATCDVTVTTGTPPLLSNIQHDDHRDVNRMESVINGDPASRALEDSFRQLERAISSLEQDIVEQRSSAGFYLHPPPKPSSRIVIPSPPPLPPAVPSRARIIHARNQFFTPSTSSSPVTSPLSDSTADDAFDKFRQKAQDGRERVAKSVVDLEEIEKLVRREIERVSTSTAASAHATAIDGNSSGVDDAAPRAKQRASSGRHHERKKDRVCPANSGSGSRSRSVGYLETNLDTLDTRVKEPAAAQDGRQKTAPRSGVLASTAKAVSMLSLRGAREKEDADRARSMEFLLDAENKAAAQPPENALMMHSGGGEDDGDGSEQRTLSQHELRVRHSLQRLDIPDWFKNSPYSKGDSTGFLRKKRDSGSESAGSQEQLRWQGLASSRTPSASSLASTPAPPTPSPSVPGVPTTTTTRPRAATAMTRVPPPYCWRYPRLSRESLQSPGSPSPSPQERGQFQFPRWSSSSTSPSPTGSLQRSLITRQPYLGWRSSERLNRDVASANSTPTHFYRSAAERLSCGPGYYALRFGGNAKPGSEGNLLSVRQTSATTTPKTKRSPVSPYATKPPIPPKPTVSPTTGLYRQSAQVISNGYSSEKDISSASSSMPARDLSTASLDNNNNASPTQSDRSEEHSPKSPSPRQRVVWMESSFVGVKPNPEPRPSSTITPSPQRGDAASPGQQTPKSRHGSGSSSGDEARVLKAKRSFGQIQTEDGQTVRDRSSSVAALEEVLDSLLAIPSSSSRSVSPNLAASSGTRTRYSYGDDSDSDTRGTPVTSSRSPSRRSSGHEPTPGQSAALEEDRPAGPTHLVYGRESAASGRQPRVDAPRTHTLSTCSTVTAIASDDEPLEASVLPRMPTPPGDLPLRGGASFDLPYDSDEFHEDRDDAQLEVFGHPELEENSPPERRGSHPRPPTPPPRPLSSAIQPETDGKDIGMGQMHVHWGEVPKMEAGAPPTREDVLRRRGSEQLRNLLPDDLLVRCSFPRCAKSVEWVEARRSFKTCHNCYTYYCSRECRRLHWDKHRRTCMYSRIRSLCKHVVLRTRDDTAVQAHLSKLARTGALTQGRGFIKLIFRNPELVERFLRQGWQALEDNPMYVAWRDLLPQELGAEVFQEVTDMCKQYNPDVKFILLAAVYVTREIPAQPVPRWEREVIAKCAKVPLRKPGGPSGDEYGDTSLEPDTLILTAVPQLSSTLSPQKARDLCFTNIQKHLRVRGVSLQHQYPDVFQKLTAYVEEDEIFTPITIYPKDVRTGKTFMCLIMPNTEPEIENMVKDFSRK